jgi:hypothetical protein
MLQQRLTAGDSLDFVDEIAEHPATDGWTLKYRLTPQFTSPVQAPITLTATTYETSAYRIQASPSVTALWPAGLYTWARWVEKSGARESLGEGTIDIRPDVSTTAQGYDPRSQAQVALADAMTALATFRSTAGRVKSYSIAGRSMEFTTDGELISIVNFWKNEVARETAAGIVANGGPDPRRIYIRMGQA